MPNLILPDDSDTSSQHQSQKHHEFGSDDSRDLAYPVDYVKLPKHLKKIADQITNKITIFDGEGYTNWMNLILKWASIYGLQRYLMDDCRLSTPTDERDDALLSRFIEAHLTDRIKKKMDLGNGSSVDLWNALKIWYGEKVVKEKVNADNDLMKKTPVISGPTTRSKSDKYNSTI